jgi:23S rRNA pseudouridine1911/1915/1917 synthase
MASSTLDARRADVPPEAAGQRLDWVLSRQPGIASRAMAQRLIREQRVRVNGAAAEADLKLRAGDAIDYVIPPPQPVSTPAQAGALDILYEDAALIVVDKPPGLSMHPGPGHPDGTLVNYLLAHCADLSGIGGALRPGIVHRLDMDTSGIVVVAKTDAAHLGLAAQFKAHTVDRTYLALVLGRPMDGKGTIDLPLGRHRTHRVRRAVSEHGKRAVTHWWIEQRLAPLCLLRLKLETGRTHQIRVHLAAQGWPVVGDPLYGGAARLKGLALAPEAKATLLAFRRQALHAAELGFTHPVTGQRLQFSSPLPEDFRGLLRALAQGLPVRRERPRQ